MLFHGSSRAKDFAPPAVALPLYRLFERKTGTPKYADRPALCGAFRISPDTEIVITGVDIDRSVERWWGLGPARLPILEGLVRCGVAAITVPNYSLISNAPRWDDLHAMKRIAIAWQEMAAVGLRTALHLNARTFSDWRRWRDFVGERSEVNTIAFEFATGAADPQRKLWYADQLGRLADEVRRPLTLILRGGASLVPQLLQSYTDVSVLDYTPIQKALHRQMANRRVDGGIHWRSVAGRDMSVDELLEHNYLELADRFDQPRVAGTLTDTRSPLPAAHC